MDRRDIDRGEVADDEVARIVAEDNLTIFNSFLHELGSRGVLADFGTELSRVDVAGMLVGVQAIDGITEEDIGHTGLDRGLQEFLEELFAVDAFLHGQALIAFELSIECLKLFPKVVLERLAIETLDLMRIKEGPGPTFAEALHEEIGD